MSVSFAAPLLKDVLLTEENAARVRGVALISKHAVD
jgi:hypothetical protein